MKAPLLLSLFHPEYPSRFSAQKKSTRNLFAAMAFAFCASLEGVEKERN